jgi:predicted XRE-type DNA-binding protein
LKEGRAGRRKAGERLAKAELARGIRNIIKGKHWTQRRAAEVLAIAPPDVSDLMRDKLARFSQERLERFLNALDMDVQIRVQPRAVGKKQADITVEFWSSPLSPTRRGPSSNRRSCGRGTSCAWDPPGRVPLRVGASA